MKIITVHNKYLTASGEDTMYNNIVKIFKEQGHLVYEYLKFSESIKWYHLPVVFFSSLWSIKNYNQFSELIKKVEPDLVYIQNLFPLISISIIKLLFKKKIKVIFRLSNYRLICPNGILYSNQKICTKCLDNKSYLNVLYYNCEKNIIRSLNSFLRSKIIKFNYQYFQGINYICQTEWHKKFMIAQGFASKNLFVLNNFIDLRPAIEYDFFNKEQFYLYLGRDKNEKGILTFLRIAKFFPNIYFKATIKNKDYEKLDNLEYLNYLNSIDKVKFLSKAKAIIFPIEWYDIFPNTIIEAMRYKCLVLVSEIISINELCINNYNCVKYRDFDELKNKIEMIESSKIDTKKIIDNAYKDAITLYNKNTFKKNLINILSKIC